MYFSIDLQTRRHLITWLSLCALLVALMVAVGGLTRLTESGLSIVEWKPVRGILPPLTAQDWQHEFDSYRDSPQYRLVNEGMSLEGFKGIFWLEYIHRLLGRLIGFFFLLPFLYFIFRRRIPAPLIWRLGGIFLLGGLQGVVGWLMVKSGLSDRPWVSPVSLMAHLSIALVILALLLQTIHSLITREKIKVPYSLRWRAGLLAILVFTQSLLGALVAGNRAGLLYNTFPKMGERWIPAEWLDRSPVYLNFIENPATVQLMHRLAAYLVALAAGALLMGMIRHRRQLPRQVRQRGYLVSAAFTFQFLLGVLTLLYQVPIFLASLHQANAVLFFTLSVWLVFDFDSRSQLEKFDRGHGLPGRENV